MHYWEAVHGDLAGKAATELMFTVSLGLLIRPCSFACLHDSCNISLQNSH